MFEKAPTRITKILNHVHRLTLRRQSCSDSSVFVKIYFCGSRSHRSSMYKCRSQKFVNSPLLCLRIGWPSLIAQRSQTTRNGPDATATFTTPTIPKKIGNAEPPPRTGRPPLDSYPK